tara:strand:+ start:209 stop:526 length:318 start_codon:yes stop_codon:yes gene_type:complete
MAFRVPTSTVSVTDFVVNIKKETTVEEINKAYKEAQSTKLKGILSITDEPLVSSDFKKDPHSCVIDGLSTMVLDNNMIKVVGWYDNEWGYSCRTADLAAYISKSI